MSAGEQPADERAHAHAADAVDEHAGVQQHLEHAEVRERPRAAAAEHDADGPARQPPRHARDVAATVAAGPRSRRCSPARGPRSSPPGARSPAARRSRRGQSSAGGATMPSSLVGVVSAARGAASPTTASTRSARDMQNSSHALVASPEPHSMIT